MYSNFVDVLERQLGASPSLAIEYSEADFPATFPYARWVAQQNRYRDFWRWWSGEIWEDVVPDAIDKDGNPVLRYPLQINTIKTAGMKRNYILFGEMDDEPGPAVPVRITPRLSFDEDAPNKDAKRKANELETVLNEIWEENNGRVIQLENGLVGQYMGGCVFKASWQPFDENLKYGVKIEMVLPDFFLPVWDSTNPDDLLEAFIVWRMPAREAFLKYGWEFDGIGQHPEYVIYIEHWTKEFITITLGGQPLQMTAAAQNPINGNIDLGRIIFDNEPNPFGFIPMVYIPHERAGEYYGLSIIDDLRGLAREYNTRMADIGDVISESAHREVYVKNAPGQIRIRDIGQGRSVTDLGQTVPGSKDSPDAFTIDPPKIADEIAQYPEKLHEEMHRIGFTSSVSDGEDQGSQRSALTLAFRLLPLTQKARATRVYWTAGLIRLNRMIAKMLIFHKVAGITEAHLENIRWYCDWANMIPRDRETDISEVNMMMGRQAMSPYTALKKLKSVSDPSEEVDRIKEWLNFLNSQQVLLAKAQADAKASAMNGKDNQAAGKKAPSSGNKDSSGSPTTEVKAPNASSNQQ